MPSDDTCPKCFHPVKAAAQSCENCGARMNRAAAEGAGFGPIKVRMAPGGDSILMTLVSAALFLWVGFRVGFEGNSDSALYNTSVTAFTWGARIVGIGLLCVAGLTVLRLPLVLVIDLIISFIAAGGCLIVAVIWLMHGDNDGLLLLLFGAFNSSAARSSWIRFRQSRAAASQG